MSTTNDTNFETGLGLLPTDPLRALALCLQIVLFDGDPKVRHWAGFSFSQALVNQMIFLDVALALAEQALHEVHDAEHLELVSRVHTARGEADLATQYRDRAQLAPGTSKPSAEFVRLMEESKARQKS